MSVEQKESPAVFDGFSHEYDAHLDTPTLLKLGGAPSRAYVELKARWLLDWLRSEGRAPEALELIDAGCGTGTAEEFLAPAVKSITGVDLSTGMVAAANRKGLRGCQFLQGDMLRLPVAEEAFDVLFSMCVFHHADPKAFIEYMREFRRVLRPGGRIAIFEHNPWNPLTRIVVRRCPVDKDVVLIPAPKLNRAMQQAGFQSVRVDYLIFFPRSMRSLIRLEPALRHCPIGAQYVVTATA
jgi:SAM-dependent methyltransferase